MNEPGPCRSCQSLVYWLTNPNTGKRMPVDAVPHEFGGNVQIDLEHGTFKVLGKAAAAEARKTERLHRSHFVTCKNAAHHRKAK